MIFLRACIILYFCFRLFFRFLHAIFRLTNFLYPCTHLVNFFVIIQFFIYILLRTWIGLWLLFRLFHAIFRLSKLLYSCIYLTNFFIARFLIHIIHILLLTHQISLIYREVSNWIFKITFTIFSLGEAWIKLFFDWICIFLSFLLNFLILFLKI